MSVASEILAAAEKLSGVASKVRERAAALAEALEEVQSCGIELRSLDLPMVTTRFGSQIPAQLDAKAASLLPKGDGQ